jgi:hypothetical protein
MKTYVTVGLTVLAGAALLETALIPGILIGGVAVLAPRYLPKGALPGLRRRIETLAGKTVQRRAAPEASRRKEPQAGAPQNVPPKFAIGQAVAKTITFRIIVTTLDFTTNYVVIGEFAIVDLQPHRRPAVLSRPRSGLELFGSWRRRHRPIDALGRRAEGGRQA